MAERKGTKKNKVGGPNPARRKVGSKKGRAQEQRANRKTYGKIANQARDDKKSPSFGKARKKKK